MEQVGSIIGAQQSGASTAVEPASARSLSVESLRQLGLMLQQLSAAFPHQEVAPETAEIFFATFESLAIQHGMKNLETALRSFLTRQKFFPHPSEVSEVLDEMAKKKQHEAAKSLPPIGCGLCLDADQNGFAGFVYVKQPTGLTFVKPCECRLARARAKKALEMGA